MVHCCLNAAMKARTKHLGYILAVCAVLIGCIGFAYKQLYSQPCNFKTQQFPIFQVNPRTSARSFVQLLKEQHLIQSETWFLIWLRLRGLSTKLQAGIYQLQPAESAEHLLQRVVHGDVLQERFQIVEGTTWPQMNANLMKAPYLNFQREDISAINTKNLQLKSSTLGASDVSSNHALAKLAQSISSIEVSTDVSILEGLFLADTYRYKAGSQAKAMLLSAHEHLQAYLLQAWQQRAPWLPYRTPYELLIVASILEKESAIFAERRLISGIIVNRLMQHMPLQMDPTVIYGLGLRYTGTLSHEDLQDNSPYNTYRHRGLPPTPIAMVGRDAIDAAAHPIQTKDLYFVAKGDGTHVFSETYEKQRQAIQRYMRKNQ